MILVGSFNPDSRGMVIVGSFSSVDSGAEVLEYVVWYDSGLRA